MERRWRVFIIVGVVTLVADLGTKFWAEAALPTTASGIGMPVSVIENFWDWRLSYNTGSAFGLFGKIPGARFLLTGVGLIALGAVGMWVRKTPNHMTRLLIGLGLVSGGAIGNLYDRVLYGKVTDFVVWKYYETQWPTFNIADVALVIGVLLLFLDLGKTEESESSDASPAKAKKKPAKKTAKKR